MVNNSIEGENVKNEYYDEYLRLAKESAKVSQDLNHQTDLVKKDLISKGYFDKDGNFNENRSLVRGNLRELKNWSSKNPSMILEIADNSKRRVWEKKDTYNVSDSYVRKEKVETADDRVLGIPYAQAMAGDRVYIVNGKVFTGWALYFSLSSIKSPEDYARNVDLVWNVPYLFAPILLKAQLGLGTGFDVNYGSESNEVPEEQMIRRYLFDTLKINSQKLVKTGFHLHTYGNAYWALRRNPITGLPDKITILQPERLKIFLDPMTTKIMFYIYLPPIIGGTTIASYPSDGRVNPNILTGTTLSYPTPIVMHPEDIIHFKQNDFTEYPFGFSDVKSCIDAATARMDVNILAPLIFKKYAKPMIHWSLRSEGLGAKQIQEKMSDMIGMLEDLEPGSDPVTTDRWTPMVIGVGSGKNDIFNLTTDVDTQIFAATGAPETYFKPKGSTDRMITKQDHTFISRMKIQQSEVGDKIEEQLIKPRLYKALAEKNQVREAIGSIDEVDEYLKSYDHWMASEPRYPKVLWQEMFKQDETQSIANAIALLNAGIIDTNRAATKVGEVPASKQAAEDMNRISLDDPLNMDSIAEQHPYEEPESNDGDDKRERGNTPSDFNEQENMEAIRGGLKSQAQDSGRNDSNVKDPSQLGGSRYAQHQTKGEENDLQEKHKHTL